MIIDLKKCLVVAVISGILSSVVFATCPGMSVGGTPCQLTSDVVADGKLFAQTKVKCTPTNLIIENGIIKKVLVGSPKDYEMLFNDLDIPNPFHP